MRILLLSLLMVLAVQSVLSSLPQKLFRNVGEYGENFNTFPGLQI